MSGYDFSQERANEMLEESDAQIDRLTSELAAAKAHKEWSDVEIANLRQDLQSAMRTNSELATENAELRAEVNEQARLLAMSSEREAKLLAELALCNGTIDSRDRNIETLSAEVERAKSDGEEVRKQLTARIAELCVETAELKHDIARSTQTNTDLLAEVERLRKEIEILRLYGNKDCTGMADDALAAMMELTEILALAREHGLHASPIPDGLTMLCGMPSDVQSFVAAVEQQAVISEKLNPWKAAAINGLVCSEIYTNELNESPTAALDALINWNVQVALDPAVSSNAAALEQQAYERGLEDAAKKCDTDNGLHGRWLAEDIRAMKEPTE